MGQADRGELERATRPGIQAREDLEARDRLCRELVGALVTSVHEARLQGLKYAASDANAAAIDVRRTPEVRRAKQEARQLAGELTPEQVRDWIAREQDASYQAACYRAGQLLRRARADDSG